jgi:hypothetical protein
MRFCSALELASSGHGFSFRVVGGGGRGGGEASLMPASISPCPQPYVCAARAHTLPQISHAHRAMYLLWLTHSLAASSVRGFGGGGWEGRATSMWTEPSPPAGAIAPLAAAPPSAGHDRVGTHTRTTVCMHSPKALRNSTHPGATACHSHDRPHLQPLQLPCLHVPLALSGHLHAP